MNKINSNEEYRNIVHSILCSDEFNKIKTIEHHGVSRFDHSLRVSYYSYIISKFLKLNYVASARAGLLHDFFLSDEERTFKDRVVSTFTHPKKAVVNAEKYFTLDEKEKNIIHAHMFPIYCSLPKYAESWVVSFVDKVVGTYEFTKKFSYKLSYITNIYLIYLFNTIK